MRERESRLPKQVFKYEYSNGNKNWCYEMREIFEALDLEYIYETFMNCNINLARQQFQKFENEKWNPGSETKPKLSIYETLKEKKKCELFVQMNMNRKEHSYLSQLRSGILPIEVEVGRYRQKPLADRLC